MNVFLPNPEGFAKFCVVSDPQSEIYILKSLI
jgi:hypothetical protein